MLLEKISVVVPCFNVENYIDKCLDSIVGQSYKNLEILLVDDGSSDSTGRKCDEWALRDKRIRVIHQENCGLSCARNKGIINATGSYISFIDSDDYLDKDFYEKLYKKKALLRFIGRSLLDVDDISFLPLISVLGVRKLMLAKGKKWVLKKIIFY